MHLFVDRLTPPEMIIRDDDFVHLVRSLRLQAGHHLTVVSLEENTYAECLVAAIRKKDMVVRIREIFSKPERSFPEISLVQAVVKKQKMDLILQKATELGVRTIIPIYTQYTVPDSVNLARWEVIIREAAMQSRRWDIPVLEDPSELRDFLKNRKSENPLICLTESGAQESFKATLNRFTGTQKSLSVAVGPEGGWSDTERILLRSAGAQLASFGQTILRAETATIAALGVLRWYFDEYTAPPMK